MFNTFAYAIVDTIQNSKKTFVDTFVSDDEVKKTLNTFVDAQTKYTKAAVDAGSSAMISLGYTFVSKKFLESFTKPFNPFATTCKGK